MTKFKLLAGAAALASMGVAAPAQALTFVLTDTGGAGVGTQARFGFEAAANYWSRVLTDKVTMNLNIGFAALAPGVLAQAGSARTLLSMNQGYAALAGDARSAYDFSSVAALQPLGVSALGPNFGAVTFTGNAFNNAGNGYIDTATRLDSDGGVNNSTLSVTKASAKALGITTDVNGNAVNYASADAAITFSSGFTWDYNPTNGINSTDFDFIGVAIHEIGHALGFVSGVDSYDARTVATPGTNGAGSLEGFVVNSQLDLFRFGAPGQLNWSTQGSPYFSVDGGLTQVAGRSWMSTGVRFGDGRQASHFRDSAAGAEQIGVMDPTSARGQMQEISGQDLAAFDVIGWNMRGNLSSNGSYNYTTAAAYNSFIAGVPEPAVWMQLILGFGVIGGAVRYRRRRAVVGLA